MNEMVYLKSLGVCKTELAIPAGVAGQGPQGIRTCITTVTDIAYNNGEVTTSICYITAGV